MGRRESREAAVKLLYQYDFQQSGLEEIIELFFDNDIEFVAPDIEKEYVLDVVNGVIRDCEKIDKLIETNSKDWHLNRMPKLDVAVLRVAVFEMLNRADIPASVSINEAVETAKKYSHEEAGNFINGILGSIYSELE